MIKFRVYEHGFNYVLKQTIISRRKNLSSYDVITKINEEGVKSFRKNGKLEEFMYVHASIEDALISKGEDVVDVNTEGFSRQVTIEEPLFSFSSEDIELGEVEVESIGMFCVIFSFSNEQIKKIFDEIYKRSTRKCIILSEVDGELKEVGEFWEER